MVAIHGLLLKPLYRLSCAQGSVDAVQAPNKHPLCDAHYSTGTSYPMVLSVSVYMR